MSFTQLFVIRLSVTMLWVFGIVAFVLNIPDLLMEMAP